ncbi:MAG: aspartate kinase, monofunctional class [Phototrophicales bacterium]|nr:MAG: aspartate kinase, monofunctional class [Phototrophicales bacterium]RMG75906.1 MAG: aspartate kinase, monofunctional class [Chloroflexota bacterium]
MKTITMKFGGTSVGSPEAIQNVVGIVQAAYEQGNRVVVVVSAMSGVTDYLLESVRLAEKSDKWGYLSLSQKIRDQHDEAINRLISPGVLRDQTHHRIQKLLEKHVELCDAINILGDATPRVIDSVVSLGERMSSKLVAAALKAHGLDAEALDAGKLLITDDAFQNAMPNWQETEKRIQEQLLPRLEEGIIPVITGFIGATPDGTYTTLGRGGSDYSAAIFAAYVDSDEFIIWTDVDGVMTTDPRLDKRARVLPHISYQEVGEMAFYGAKVVHPKTVQPILNKGIPIWVRNTFNPNSPGTLITDEIRESATVIKAVTHVRNISMLTVSGAGMLGVPGIAGRTFLATAKAGASILMISQASSEQSFCFTVPDEKAQAVKTAVEDELRAEINHKNVDGVHILQDVVIVTVVGAGMRGTPGVAGRVFTTLGNHNINVLAIAQGASECSISFVIDEKDLKNAVIQLHDLALETVTNGI